MTCSSEPAIDSRILGAASGFGLACTLRLVSEGAKVVAADRDQIALSKHFGGEHSSIVPLVVDVTLSKDWNRMVEVAESTLGGLDILINNAGYSYKNKPALDVSEAEFDQVMSVNVKSVFFSVHAVVPALQRRGGGCIINISSIGAKRPRPGLIWYSASKGAVSVVSRQSPTEKCNVFNFYNGQATKGLASEFGRHQIRVNAICPLLSGTGLFEQFAGVPYTQENMQKFLFNVPLGRLTDPSDVANACAFLASDEGAFITGVCLEVDGGRKVGA